MEIEVSSSIPPSTVDLEERNKDQVRVRRKTLKVVLEQCQRALELLNNADGVDDDGYSSGEESKEVESSPSRDSSSTSLGDQEADELCDLLKSRVECPDFIEKLECAQLSVSQNITEEGSSWDMISENDLWEAEIDESDQEDYVLVREEDIVEGIACFMAAYLLSLKQTKDLAPTQLQEALSKTFSVKKKKGKLRKAWDGSKVIYNVASWGATAIGLYQNPVLFGAASKAFWTSCHVISKLL
ncbi:hypothetical protein POPTR_005G157500v4 [Populus trichocarpa]|uniref:Uncharacterized protein n=1 Tax=Populus trichocarpa TaxID=3694 RepID=A0A2K2AHD1_POPTR|nr:uncharacterized protein LOC7486559 [Populus trichocarpa]KAI5588984.1 hypothetical protein BDE02_05G131300 [Populus trichocarpa]PNT36928.1 hypothetical protein POPTR_005G157500v4 [Populus trichocarpa]|eukprot:XP_002306543.3 uncharacterized protein LOC7486559 [Populus trichocarpa]